ncbi:AraC family transcriptional regulator [Curtobacterium flaccumfaciens pv. oortii]|uniref:AraC family transcriptional regulator n=1 Tax=Curtobacterium flaccumfaciens TaxID=2035 RepID=UPI001BDF5D8E|nr:helix-turn-helix domain-containing protein [Curtobacterium flaccumfaciens]MBT1624152.1 AraC family transcriptional regulator [Curtobacterium flaccumfaciens pv. oortii]
MTDERARVQDDVRSADVDEARDFLVGAYDASEWRAETTAQPFTFRYSAVGDSTMTLRAIRFDGHLDGVMTPSDDFVVQWITRGTGFIGEGDDRLVSAVGRPQLWPQDGAAFTYQDYDQRLVQINRASLEEVAGERGAASGGVQLDHTVQPDDRAVTMWRNTVKLISHTVLDRQVSPLLQAEMGRLGALALLELYPVVSATLPDELLLPRNAHIRRAVEYVHEHAHLPITSTDLAEVASLSLRALQQAFQRQLGVSPNGYLRGVRLDRVRDELLHADPAGTSIADVARQWGFAHAGRFSAAYLERHGEYPRDTMRRA